MAIGNPTEDPHQQDALVKLIDKAKARGRPITFLSAEHGVLFDPKGRGAYISSWIKAPKNDKNEVFKAAADASKACDLHLG